MENGIPYIDGNNSVGVSEGSKRKSRRTLSDVPSFPEMAHVTKFRARHFISSHSMDGAASSTGSPIRFRAAKSELDDDYGTMNGQPESSEPKKVNHSSWWALWHMICGNYINLMLIFVPLSQVSVMFGWGATSRFILSFLAMIPLASLLGDLTEEVAEHLGQTAGGLISASFGNAPELVFSIQALRADQVRVVQASLLGSVLSNLLLVLGSSFFAGGLFSGKKEQYFNTVGASANTCLLLMSSLALFLPCYIGEYNETFNVDILLISRFTAIGMLAMYVQLMLFQFKTHKHVFSEEEDHGSVTEEEDEHLSLGPSIIALAVVTLLVAVFSEYLVQSINGFTEYTNLSTTFVGIILIPFIGNVVEHIVAVTVAMKDKMELSMGIAIGSACQVSLFVIPTCVLLGWAMDKNLTLDFPKLEMYMYLIVVLIVCHLVGAGSTNWLYGAMLITSYFMIALAIWFEKVLTYSTTDPN